MNKIFDDETLEVNENNTDVTSVDLSDTNIYQDTLEHMIKIATDFREGKLSKEELDEYCCGLPIRPYLPLLTKTKTVSLIMIKLFANPIYALELKMAELYMDMFFYGLLQEYCFIDCTNIELINFDNYDLLYSLFASYILDSCGKDYEMFMHFFWDNLNIHNIQELGESIERIDPIILRQDTIANKKILDEFAKNEELIKSLNNVSALLDPNVTEIAEIIKNDALKQALEKKSVSHE